MRAVRRGMFQTLTLADGMTPVRAEVYACTVMRQTTNGRHRFLTLDMSDAHGDGIDVMRRVDARIRHEAGPRFSPLHDGGDDFTAIVKLNDAEVRFETWDGGFAVPFDLNEGMCVDVALKLGAFGPFGYCWLLERVKPHDGREPPVSSLCAER
jgi:hypothetical protein